METRPHPVRGSAGAKPRTSVRGSARPSEIFCDDRHGLRPITGFCESLSGYRFVEELCRGRIGIATMTQ